MVDHHSLHSLIIPLFIGFLPSQWCRILQPSTVFHGVKKKTLLPPSQENDAEVPFRWPGPIGSKIHHVYSNGVPNFYGLNWPQKKKNKSLISARKCSGPFTDYKSVWNHAIYGPSDTLWLCQKFAIENGPVEIVDFPINSMVIFRYVNVYQRLMLIFISPSKNITATYFANFHHPPLSSHSNHLKNHWLFNIAMV